MSVEAVRVKALVTRVLTLVVRGLILAYQVVPAYFFRGSCRFEPGCSRYASEAVAVHGPVKGGWLAVRRICRCHPWGGLGYDPVPPPAGANALRRAGPPADPHAGSSVLGREGPPRTPRPLEF